MSDIHTPAVPETSTDLNATISATDTVKLIDEETVSYTYDSKTKLEYSLTYMGFKEDIVVREHRNTENRPLCS